MAVLILPVLHREVVPPHGEVVPLDRYNRCLERLYRSRIGPEVVPVMYRSTTGLVSVVVRLLGGCGPVVPLIAYYRLYRCSQRLYRSYVVLYITGRFVGTYLRGVFFPNGSLSFELVFFPHC